MIPLRLALPPQAPAPVGEVATDTTATVNMAIGRIFGMMQRAEMPGDAAEYERCRLIILSLAENDYLYVPMSAPMPGWNFGRGTSGVIE